MGDTITIKGQDDGEQIAITLLKVVPTSSNDGFDAPSSGHMWYAAQFRITNTGTQAYSDDPDNDGKLIDRMDQQYGTTIIGGSVRAGALLPTDLHLAVGGRVLGYIVFEVPKGTKVAGIQYGIDSGFSNVAQWNVS